VEKHFAQYDPKYQPNIGRNPTGYQICLQGQIIHFSGIKEKQDLVGLNPENGDLLKNPSAAVNSDCG